MSLRALFAKPSPPLFSQEIVGKLVSLQSLSDKDSCGAKPPHDPELNQAERFIHFTCIWRLRQVPIGDCAYREADGNEFVPERRHLASCQCSYVRSITRGSGSTRISGLIGGVFRPSIRPSPAHESGSDLHRTCYDFSAGLRSTGCGVLECLGTVGKIKVTPEFLFEDARARRASMLLCKTPTEPASLNRSGAGQACPMNRLALTGSVAWPDPPGPLG